MDYTNKKIADAKEMLQKREVERQQLAQAMHENTSAIIFLNGYIQALEELEIEHADTANSEVISTH